MKLTEELKNKISNKIDQIFSNMLPDEFCKILIDKYDYIKYEDRIVHKSEFEDFYPYFGKYNVDGICIAEQRKLKTNESIDEKFNSFNNNGKISLAA